MGLTAGSHRGNGVRDNFALYAIALLVLASILVPIAIGLVINAAQRGSQGAP